MWLNCLIWLSFCLLDGDKQDDTASDVTEEEAEVSVCLSVCLRNGFFLHPQLEDGEIREDSKERGEGEESEEEEEEEEEQLTKDNPMYVPRGHYFEHDSRLDDKDGDEEGKEEKPYK